MAKKNNTLTYAWVISSMESQLVEGSLVDVVINVNWRRTAKTADYNPTVDPQVGYYTDVYGQLSLPGNPDPATFIPYADLTIADVEVWLNAMTDPTPGELDINLAAQIELLINPINATLPLPFVE